MIRPASPLLALILAACGPSTGSEDPLGSFCIEVDGVGHDSLTAALAAATAGQTVTVCETALEENVVIDRDLTLIGSGPDLTVITAPINEHAIEIIDGATVTLSGFGFSSSRSAIKVDDAALVFSDSVVIEAGSYGVRAVNGASIDIDAVTFGAAEWGAVSIKGSSLTLENSRVDGATAFGVKLVDGSSATLTDNTFSNIAFSGNGADGDGWGVWVASESEATLTGNRHENVASGGIRAEDGAGITVRNEQVVGANTGAWIDQTPLIVDGLSIEGAFAYGLAVFSVDGALIENLEILTDPETSAPHTGGLNPQQGSAGLWLEDSHTTVRHATISGNNGFGLVNQRRFDPDVSLFLEDVRVEDNGRIGMALYSSDVELVDVSVLGTIDNDAACIQIDPQTNAATYSCNFGVLSSNSTLNWSGGSVSDNESFGIVTFQGALTLTEVEVSRNDFFGVTAQDSALNVSSSHFEANNRSSVRITSNSYAEIDQSTFTSGHGIREETDVDEFGNEYLTLVYNDGVDVWASSSTALVTESTFTDGDRAVYGYDSDLTLRDSTITDYNELAFYSYGLSNNTATIERTEIENVGGNAVYCVFGSMSVDKVNIRETTEVDTHIEFYTNGVFDFDIIYSSPAPAVYANQCALELDEVRVDGVDDRGIYGLNSSVIFSDVEVTGANRGIYASSLEGVVELDYSSSTPDVYLSELTIPDAQIGYGLRIDGVPGGSVDLAEIEIGTVFAPIGSGGMLLSNLDSFSLTGVSIENTAGHGIELANVTGVITADGAGSQGTITSAGGHGLAAGNSTLTLSGATILHATDNGIYANGSNLVVLDTVIDNAGGSGLYFDGGTQSVDSTVTVSAGSFGMECVNGPSFDTCSPTLSGQSGPSFGCDACN